MVRKMWQLLWGLTVGVLLGCTAPVTPPPHPTPIIMGETLPANAYEVSVESDDGETCVELRLEEVRGLRRGCVPMGDPLPTIVYGTLNDSNEALFLVAAPATSATTLEVVNGALSMEVPFTVQGDLAVVGLRLKEDPESYEIRDGNGRVTFPQ